MRLWCGSSVSIHQYTVYDNYILRRKETGSCIKARADHFDGFQLDTPASTNSSH